MKESQYEVKVAFTSNELLCCSCSCQAGSKSNDRGVCVHVLPLILLFVILLVEGLAQNILVELSHRWNNELEMKHSHCITEIKTMLKCLMTASNHQSGEPFNEAHSVTKLLSDFSVGTEKEKTPLQEPKLEELIPLSALDLSSNSMIAAKRMGKKLAKKINKDEKEDKKVSNQNRTARRCAPCPIPGINVQPHQSTATIMIKKGIGGSIQPIPCDFCEKTDTNTSSTPIMTTSHVCRMELPTSLRFIEGSTSRICGLAFCINCRIKHGTLEGPLCDSRCFIHNPLSSIHSNSSNTDREPHVNLPDKIVNQESSQGNISGKGATMESNIRVFTPNYNRIHAGIEALLLIYNVDKLHKKGEEPIGYQLLRYRSTLHDETTKKETIETAKLLLKDALSKANHCVRRSVVADRSKMKEKRPLNDDYNSLEANEDNTTGEPQSEKTSSNINRRGTKRKDLPM